VVWCHSNGFKPITQEYFSRDLDKKGIRKVKSNTMFFIGIKLKRSYRA
jgi:arginine repressor